MSLDIRDVLCGAILVSRVGDVGTTYLATPKLTMEMNPIVRKLGWRFGVLTLAACIVPYFSIEAGVGLVVPFLLVSASNAGKIWIMRTMGEQAYMSLLLEVARKSKLRHAVIGVLASSGFLILAAGVVFLFYPSPDAGMAFWIALGILMYALAVALYGSLFARRIFRRAAVATS